MSLLNIDIINQIVANETKLNTKAVALVNKFYWDCNTQHVRRLDLQPINFMGIGYLRHSQYLIRAKILKLVAKLRQIEHSNKYKPDGVKKLSMVANYQRRLRELWQIRNIKTFELDE